MEFKLANGGNLVVKDHSDNSLFIIRDDGTGSLDEKTNKYVFDMSS